ncbi:MAG: MotA/TolQ/ExbB proton channel family protein [Pseudomonadota bacterium]
MFDTGALTIVLAGTVIATLARCGWSDIKIALTALKRIATKDFDLNENRMALAPAISEIKRRGPLCTDIPLPPDPSMARTVIAFARSGSIEHFRAAHHAERASREGLAARAVRTFEYAGELAPVFGLVGTLFAITQLSPFAGEGPVEIAMGSIATAVLSSLYGVLIAHLIFIPLARAIERKAMREEDARAQLVEWLETSLAGRARPASAPREHSKSRQAA